MLAVLKSHRQVLNNSLKFSMAKLLQLNGAFWILKQKGKKVLIKDFFFFYKKGWKIFINKLINSCDLYLWSDIDLKISIIINIFYI